MAAVSHRTELMPPRRPRRWLPLALIAVGLAALAGVFYRIEQPPAPEPIPLPAPPLPDPQPVAGADDVRLPPLARREPPKKPPATPKPAKPAPKPAEQPTTEILPCGHPLVGRSAGGNNGRPFKYCAYGHRFPP